MACSLKGKCHNCSTFFQALLATVKMLLAILMNLAALASLVIAILFVNGCYASERAINEPDWKNALPEGFHLLLDTCIYPNANGAVSNFIEDTQRFDTISDMTETFSQPFSKYDEDTSVPGSKALDKYYKDYFKPQIEEYQSNNLFAKSSGENPQTFLDTENNSTDADAISCNYDKFALSEAKCPSEAPAHLPINKETPPRGRAVNTPTNRNCIVIPKWDIPFDDGTDGRYAVDTGACANARVADLERIRLCTTDIDTKIQNFKLAIQDSVNGPNGKATAYYAAIGNIET